MKLVELLARELDVWPKGCAVVVQEHSGRIHGCSTESVEYGGGRWSSADWWAMTGSEDYSSCNQYGAVLDLSDDHSTAIITRADWKAERERIAGGWIAHDGGECPVLRGTKVDVEYRDGGCVMNCGALTYESESIYCAKDWSHTGSQRDIIAYRLHKLEQQEQEEMTPCEKLGYKVGDLFEVTESSWFEAGEEIRLTRDDASGAPMFERADGSHVGCESLSFVRKITDSHKTAITVTIKDADGNQYNPIHTRNRILEIDRTTEALEEERVQLVQRLADEGFSLLQVVVQSELVEDMSDWRNWREGDMLVVEDNAPDTHEFKVGELVKFMHHDENHGESAPHCESNDADWWVLAENLKFHSRPTA